ncbi:MAG: hypothetical protein U9Q33_09465 [Campylobacterota bacterium]|nr:hypothetical protein [Campylobacterota bacterium]
MTEKYRYLVDSNIIASTAQINELILVTRNVKDFNSININTLNIFDKSEPQNV